MFRIDRNYVKMSDEPVPTAAAREEPADKLTPEAEAEAAYEPMSETEEYMAELAAEAAKNAELMAEEILSKARDEAEIILREAQADAELLKERAWDEGYKEGKTAADEESEMRRTEDMESIERVLSEINRERTRVFDEMESEIVDLTFAMVKKIVNLAEETDDKIYESMITKALRKVKLEGSLTIRVSNEDYERYFSTGSMAYTSGDESKTASVIPDSSLGSWDCVIDTAESTVNAGLDSQLKQIRLAFKGAGQ